MGRHSSDTWVKLTARVPRGQQGFWDLIRARKRFTIPEIDYASCLDRKTVRDFVLRLERGGYVRHVATEGHGGHQTKVYELVADQPEAPQLRRDGSPAVRVGRANEQMWRTMRMLGQFTWKDLAVAASTEAQTIRAETARRYCELLARAGYLAVMDQGGPGRSAVYYLPPSKRTGPLAPQVQRTKFVFDPNTGKVAGHGEPMGGPS